MHKLLASRALTALTDHHRLTDIAAAWRPDDDLQGLLVGEADLRPVVAGQGRVFIDQVFVGLKGLEVRTVFF